MPADLEEQCMALLNDYDVLSSIQVPQDIASMHTCVTIHAFCNASATTYGVAIYFVADSVSKLVTVRTKVAPVKSVTIPKDELTAILLLARLVKYVQEYSEELTVVSVHLWSDSQIPLSWAFSNKSLVIYVRNRVDEICSL